jgi:hypothetical protein
MTRFAAATVTSIFLAAFTLLPVSAAENCLGGELTADGKCLCTGQVVMSGETYLLEYSRGKCLPRQCPVGTLPRDGKCVATSAGSPAPGAEPSGGERPAPPKEVHRRASRFSISAGSLRHYYYRIYRVPAYSY